MEILAHTGANYYFPDALSVNLETGQLAVAVNRTVVLYSDLGVFQTELRTAGRGRVTAVAFCPGAALSHVLAVASVERIIRFIDHVARRILHDISSPFPKEESVVIMRFLPSSPRFIVVISSKGSWAVLDTAKESSSHKPLQHGCLDLNAVHSAIIADVAGKPVLFVVGSQSSAGVLSAISLDSAETYDIIHGPPIYDIDVRPVPEGKVLLAVIGPLQVVPIILIIGKNGLENNDALATLNYQLQDTGKKQHRFSVAWMRDEKDFLLFSSDVDGEIHAWVWDANSMRHLLRRKAHYAEVFSMLSGINSSIVTTSRDRLICVWRIDGRELDSPELVRVWRSIGIVPPIKAIATTRWTRKEPHGSDEQSSEAANAVENSNGSRSQNDSGIDTAERWSISYVTSSGFVTAVYDTDRGLGIASRYSFHSGRAGNSKPHTALLSGFHRQSGRMSTVMALSIGRISLVGCYGSCVDASDTCKVQRIWAMGNHRVFALAEGFKACEWRIVPTVSGGLKLERVYLNESLHTATGLDVTAACPFGSLILVGGKGQELKLWDHSKGSFNIDGVLRDSVVTELAATFNGDLVAVVTGGSMLHVVKLTEASPGTWSLSNVGWASLVRKVTRMVWAESSREAVALLACVDNKGDATVWECGDGVLQAEKLMDLREGQDGVRLRAALKESPGTVTDVAWCGDHVLLSAGADGTLRRWDVDRLPRPKI